MNAMPGADQRKHSSTSLAFVRGIHWWPIKFPTLTQKMFLFDDVIMSFRVTWLALWWSYFSGTSQVHMETWMNKAYASIRTVNKIYKYKKVESIVCISIVYAHVLWQSGS